MLKKLLSLLLRAAADKLESGNCDVTDEQIMESVLILSDLDSTLWLSKDLSCQYLGVSRSTFDSLVHCGVVPEGHKIKGFKEKVWTKAQLTDYKYRDSNY